MKNLQILARQGPIKRTGRATAHSEVRRCNKQVKVYYRSLNTWPGVKGAATNSTNLPSGIACDGLHLGTCTLHTVDWFPFFRAFLSTPFPSNGRTTCVAPVFFAPFFQAMAQQHEWLPSQPCCKPFFSSRTASLFPRIACTICLLLVPRCPNCVLPLSFVSRVLEWHYLSLLTS
jgi:hypothetical protein